MNLLRTLVVVIVAMIAIGGSNIARADTIPMGWPNCASAPTPDCPASFDYENDTLLTSFFASASYDAETDQFLQAFAGEMDIVNPSGDGNGFEGSTTGIFSMQTRIDEDFNILDPGSMVLAADIGNGLQLLVSGSVFRIGFAEVSIGQFDEDGPLTAQWTQMQIVFELDYRDPLLDAWESDYAAYFYEVQISVFDIGDESSLVPYSPFASDFTCTTSGDGPCSFYSTPGIRGITFHDVPEPGTLALLSLGLLGLGLSRRKKV